MIIRPVSQNTHASLATGESDLFGAPHLVHKESDRLNRLAGLLQELGRPIEIKEDGLKILAGQVNFSARVVFDCDHDHRLAFAAAVLKAGGANLEIRNAQVVSKSFPKFWEILGWQP